MKKLTSLFALLCATTMLFAEPRVTLDFSTNTWGLPEGSANKATASANFTSGDYTITLAAADGYYFNTAGYLMLGKKNSTLTLPAFDFAVGCIVMTGGSAASTATLMNLFIGDNAVSTQTTGSIGPNYYYIKEAANQTAGSIYTIKVLSAHNSQIVKLEIYAVGEEPEDPEANLPEDGATLTCAQAQAAAFLCETGYTTTRTYTVTGYVVEDDYDATISSHQQKMFWMADAIDGGKVLEAYWTNVTNDEPVNIGDQIELTGHLLRYNATTAEIKNGDVVVKVAAAAPTGITLDQTTATVKANENITLVATRQPANAGGAITWTSSDESVATVNKGIVSGIAVGTATITATLGEFSATCEVTVTEAAEIEEITCAQAKVLALNLEDNATTPKSYTVVGYVISAGNISKDQQILAMNDTKNATDTTFISFYGNCPKDENDNNIKFSAGDKVKVTGKILNYQGKAEIKNGEVVAVEGGTAVVEQVITPSQATEIASALAADATTPETYTIEGWVVETKSVDDATKQSFYLSDTKGGSDKFYIYNATGEESVEVDYKVRVKGATLTNYKGNTPETKAGATVVIIDNGISADAIILTPTAATAVYDEDFETYTFTFTAADGKAVSLTAAAKQHTRLVGEYTKTGNNKASVTDGTAADLASATLTIIYKGQNADEKPLYEVKFSGKTAANKEYVINKVVLPIPATEGGQAVAIEERYWASEARAIAEKLNDGEKTTDTYVLLGFVTEIVTAYGTDAKYPQQQSFWIADTKDGGQVFQVYGAVGLKETVALGAKVEISATILQNYKGTYETNHSSTIRILEEGEECPAAEEGFIRISEAIAIANALEDGAKSETTYKVRAKITKISTTQEKYDEFDADKKNLNITISDCSGAIDCFYTNDKENKPFTCAFAELPVKVGDEVVIEGPLKKYVKKSGETVTGTTPEFENAWFVEYAGGSAVENIFIELNLNAPMYNVLGVQVGKDYKGIVIQNGQKYLLR